MALRVKSRPIPGIDQLDEFWTEYRKIEESLIPQQNEEDHEEPAGECELEVDWLKEAGFDELVKKYKDSKEIDPDDVDVKDITASLTRTQAEAVRRRINTLNDNTKKRLGISVNPTPLHSSKYSNHADVRTIFPVQTTGLPSNANLGSGTESNSDTYTAAGRDPSVLPQTSGPNARPTGSVANVTSSPGSKSNIGNNISGLPRPILSRRAASEGVNLMKPGTGSDDTCNYGIAGKYSSLADVNGEHPTRENRERSGGGQPLHPQVERRGSEEIRVHSGVQQTKHHHGSVFYITGLSKQELFNAAEKTKESVVDEVEDSRLNIKDLSVSTPSTTDTEHEKIHENAVDVPDVNLSPKINGQASPRSKYKPQQFTKLPNYTLTKDELGVTQISDFSKQDMEKVRSLALIELTALFDSHTLPLHRRKPIKKKVKETGIFGVPLQYMLQHDRSKGYHTKLPIFLKEVISYLDREGLKEEGILRVSGSTTRIKALKEEIEETFNEGSFSLDGQRPHDVVSLLKTFLRELPFPVLTHEYQPTFGSVESIPDRRQQLQALNLLILLLPPVHRDCLRILLLFLKEVIAHEKHNKMSLSNVAMIMAPNLFLFKSQSDLQEIRMAQGAVNVVRMLIKYQSILWTIPGFMVMQVRYLYEAEGNKRIKDAKAVRKLLLKRNKEATGNSPQKKQSITDVTPADVLEADLANNIIRVKAPMLNKIAMVIQLIKGMTAGDVVDKFKRRPEGSTVHSRRHELSREYRKCVNPHGENKFAQDSHFLYEVGGNIGERRLDHDTNMIALYKVNPSAEWIIKPLQEYVVD